MGAIVDMSGHPTTTENDHGERRSVAIVGAGITGLVAAYELRRRGVNVTLYEASHRTGGTIQTTHADGFLAEHGPNSFVTSAPVDALLQALRLTDDVVEANPEAQRRYLVRDGQLRAFPMTPPAMLSTKLLSLRAKLRILLEPLMRTRLDTGDESVASFVRRRMGHEVLDYTVDPFISGIFAGDPETLSMAHAFPRVLELERRYGSLSKGLMAQRRRAVSDAATPTSAGGPMNATTAPVGASPARARLISFVDGMQTLTDALEASLAGTLQLECPVSLVHRDNSRWVVDAGADGRISRRFEAIVMATPAHALAAMELPAALRRFSAPIERVEYPPMSTVTLGFARRDVAHALDGFGVLVPAVEQRSVLGVLFNSTLFPERAPDGYVTLTCFVGGARMPERAREDSDLLMERVLTDLRQLLGVQGEPVFASHVYWPRAIPQYAVGYQTVKDAADDTERLNPGLYLAGNYRNGVSVGDCVASGMDVGERVAAYLARAG